MTRVRRTLLLATLAAVSAGCGTNDAAPVGASGTAPSCAAGQVAAPGGGCMPVGIQGCAASFIEADGLCHPTLDQCPVGTIPKFDEGCVPMGVGPDCAAEFLEADGLSHALVADTAVRDASRAGLLFESADGSIAGTHSTGSRFGLVLQGEPTPAFSDPGNLFAGTEQDMLVDGALPVPASPPLPQAPQSLCTAAAKPVNEPRSTLSSLG